MNDLNYLIGRIARLQSKKRQKQREIEQIEKELQELGFELYNLQPIQEVVRRLKT